MSSDTPVTSAKSTTPQRVLACVLCQHRKVKCDRQFPCATCIKSGAECVQAVLAPRRRRHKVTERRLLDRLRKYEDLLRQNDIAFDKFNKDTEGEADPHIASSDHDSDREHPDDAKAAASTSSAAITSKGAYETKNRWHTMSRGFRDPDNESNSSHDDVRETAIKKLWAQACQNDDHLLFGSLRMNVDLSTSHPDPVQIFRLWQAYLDNVNPLLKVTHTPTLQGRIIEAASNTANIEPTLEALMFGIYCSSTSSLNEEDCQALFQVSKKDLLVKYQLACQQALSNCGFLRSNERDSLTALYLYMFSTVSNPFPLSLYAILGVATRIAQRMGIHVESALSKCTILEAEMRRRLWWSLVLFDARICELANSPGGALDPTWDCKIPLNVNDSDLLPEMKALPKLQGKSTEALFAVVRSEIGEYLRHTSFYLDFTSPALKPVAKIQSRGSIPEGGELVELEKMIEHRYLNHCVSDNPLHFMTTWTTRAFLAKCRLLEHHSRYGSSGARQTEAQLDTASSLALWLLECDTKIMTSPYTTKFLWFNDFYFPFPSYIHLAQDLKRRPSSEQARRAWDVMSDNYEARYGFAFLKDDPFFRIFSKLVLTAWKACETIFQRSSEPSNPPTIVKSIRETVVLGTEMESSNHPMDMGIDEFPVTPSTRFLHQNLPTAMEMQHSFAASQPELFPDLNGQAPPMHASLWTVFGGWPGWPGY